MSYSYDPTTSNLITITAADGGTLSLSYDGNLLLTETWAGTVNGSVSRTYDNDFRVASQSVNGSNPVNLSYDLDSLLVGSGALSVTRDPQTGLVTGTTLGLASDSSSYSSFGELSGYSASSNGATVFAVRYTRDPLGRITEKAETVAGVGHIYDYNYDLAGRLTDVTTDGTVTGHYEYDSNSNRIAGYTAGGTISASYDDQDRLLAYGTATYSYTANGELASKTDANGTTTYTYDVLGNLTAVTLRDGTQIQYVIDGKNRRIGKKVNGTLTQGFLYDGRLRIVAELDGSNNVVSRFVYGDKANIPDYMVRGGASYRLITDHLGSPRLVVDTATGAVVQRMDFDEFGNVLADTNPGFQPFGFAGGLYDRDTKLVRFGARDYDAQTGMWTAKDPIGFIGGDTSLYGYVLGDPINFSDPLGLARLSGESFMDCLYRHAHAFYGTVLDTSDAMAGVFTIANALSGLGQTAFNGIVEHAAEGVIKNADIAGALAGGTLSDVQVAARHAEAAAARLAITVPVLKALDTASQVAAAGAFGFSIGARAAFTGQCLDGCPSS